MPFEHARRRGYCALYLLEQADPDIHLQELEAVFHAPLQPLAHDRAIRHRVGIAIDQHLVAEFPASQLIGGNAIGFTGEIEKSHLDAADATAMPPVKAELLDLAEDLVDIAGILADQA